ncbi:MAG: hypothetical protein IJ036_05520 [Lachnospiraceae bacterium]|nr:hypothetical protein [Lachnospiraceae bacterium]
MNEKKTSLTFKIIKGLIKFFYLKIEVVGEENLPDQPSIIVGNHSQMNGPLACEFYFPGDRYIWCAGQMMRLKDVPAYAYEDFWSGKPKRSRWFYKILSYLIAPLSVCIFNNAHTIGVYRDARIISTFKETVRKLQEGCNVIVFPECNETYNNILYNFQDRFIDIAKTYQKKTGKELSFVPLYIAPKLKKMYIGKPIRYCGDNPMPQERRRICEYLMAEITDMACKLPRHTVVPYRNIPKKYYPSNIPQEVAEHEKTNG